MITFLMQCLGFAFPVVIVLNRTNGTLACQNRRLNFCSLSDKNGKFDFVTASAALQRSFSVQGPESYSPQSTMIMSQNGLNIFKQD